MTYRSLTLAFSTLLCLASPAFATPIAITSSAIPSTTFNPSNDAISFNAGDTTLSAAGTVVLQTGNLSIGDSQIPDQLIPFSFTDIITVDGISRTLTISGQDNVTSSADVITFFASSPVDFGNYILTVNQASYSANSLGDFPISLSADVSPAPVPEPGTLLFLVTGLVSGVALVHAARKGEPSSVQA